MTQDPWTKVDPFGVGAGARAMLKQMDEQERERQILARAVSPVTLKALDPADPKAEEHEQSAKIVDENYRRKWAAYGW